MADIYFQKWLDDVGDAFFANRFDIYENAISLPLEIVSDTQSSRVETVDELRHKFDTWVDMLQTHRATDMIRVAQRVRLVAPDRMIGDYYTEVLSNAARVMPRFASSMMLEKQADIWRATRVTTGMTQDQWPLFLVNHTENQTDQADSADRPEDL